MTLPVRPRVNEVSDDRQTYGKTVLKVSCSDLVIARGFVCLMADLSQFQNVLFSYVVELERLVVNHTKVVGGLQY